MSARGRAGFTLLEVMVALAVLAVGLMALADLSGSALRNHGYARDLSRATLLARGKIAQLEEQYDDSGFKDFDETQEGDFGDEGHPEMRWKAELRKPEGSLGAEQLLGILVGAGKDSSMQDLLAKLMGGTGSSSSSGGPQVTPGATGASAATLLQTQINAFAEQIKSSLRKMTVTVSWRDGKRQHDAAFTEHLVVLYPKAPGGQRGLYPDVPPNVPQVQSTQRQGIPGLPGATGAQQPGATAPVAPAAPRGGF